MKSKIIPIFITISLIAGFINLQVGAEPRRVLMEFATGTWCGYCPCGDSIIEHFILPVHPETVVLAYHGGGGGDPFINFHGNEIIAITGYQGYPLAIFDRQSGQPMDYDYSWPDTCNVRYIRSPNTVVNLSITSKNYNPSTREISATVNATALQNMSGTYAINFVITEDGLVYPQNYYAYCGIAGYHNDFVHNWVVRNMINGARGDTLNTSAWNQNQTITKTISDTLSSSWVADNCKLIVFVYKINSQIITSEVQQSLSQLVTAPLGININSEKPTNFSLSQNYPNPFNPFTNIKFSIPKDGNVSLKVYDVLGNEVTTFVNGFMRAGVYNAEFDGSRLSSGIYLYTLRTADFLQTKKMILMK
jgi:hypothetical protein